MVSQPIAEHSQPSGAVQYNKGVAIPFGPPSVGGIDASLKKYAPTALLIWTFTI